MCCTSRNNWKTKTVNRNKFCNFPKCSQHLFAFGSIWFELVSACILQMMNTPIQVLENRIQLYEINEEDAINSISVVHICKLLSLVNVFICIFCSQCCSQINSVANTCWRSLNSLNQDFGTVCYFIVAQFLITRNNNHNNMCTTSGITFRGGT